MNDKKLWRSWALLPILSLVAIAHTESNPTFSRVLLADPPSGGQPSVALESNHGFVVTWQSTQQEVTSLNWLALDFDGVPTGRGVIAKGSNWFVNWADTPALAVLENGDWVAFWLQRNDPAMLKATTSGWFARPTGGILGQAPSRHIISLKIGRAHV